MPVQSVGWRQKDVLPPFFHLPLVSSFCGVPRQRQERAFTVILKQHAVYVRDFVPRKSNPEKLAAGKGTHLSRLHTSSPSLFLSRSLSLRHSLTMAVSWRGVLRHAGALSMCVCVCEKVWESTFRAREFLNIDLKAYITCVYAYACPACMCVCVCVFVRDAMDTRDTMV